MYPCLAKEDSVCNSVVFQISHISASDARLRMLLQQYSCGEYEITVNELMLLLNDLVITANLNQYSYFRNDDISLCAVSIIDCKYRLGAYRECLDLIQNYSNNFYYSEKYVLPELLKGWCYLVLSQHGHAEKIARAHLQSNYYSNSPEITASFLFLLGKSKFMLKKFIDARQHYSDSLALFRYAGDADHACVVLCALGLLEKEVGQLTKSIEYYDKAYELVDRAKYKDRANDILLNKSIALYKIGKYDAALSVINNSNLLNIPPLLVAKISIIRARIYLAINTLNSANEEIRVALSLLECGSYAREESVCLETCGDIACVSNNAATAAMYYNRAEQIARTIDDSADLLGGIMMRQARLCNKSGEYGSGLELCKKSLVLLNTANSCHDLGVTLRTMAESYLGLQNYQLSFKCIIKSISVLQSHQSMRELAESQLTAAGICVEWHKYYQESESTDSALAALVVDSYNNIAFDNKTLYEAAWNHALEAHTLYSLYCNADNCTSLSAIFEAVKSLRRVNNTKSLTNSIAVSTSDLAIVSYSRPMKSVLAVVDIAACTDEPILITGETGTGKEMIARLIHEHSTRSMAPFVPVNCAAIPEQLFEREFFGNVKGAYTGAESSVGGLSEQADGGTLFLDEIGEMPQILQAKLLRLLQDGSFHRLGDPALKNTNIRFIAATNADIASMVAANQFRPDFYYRLTALELYVPPLRDRREDIEPLATLFIQQALGEHYMLRDIVDDEIYDILHQYPWPGNVRELESITKRLALFTKHNMNISVDMLPSQMQLYAKSKRKYCGSLHLDSYLENAERERIMQSLISSGGNRTLASYHLGISRKALYAKMKRMNIKFPI